MKRKILKILEEIDNPKGTPLVYDEFKEYEIMPSFKKGQWKFKFDNNYGASVIKRYGSYGYEQDLFELAVFYYDGKDDFKGQLTYITPITKDVLGYLTNEEVLETLEKIKELK